MARLKPILGNNNIFGNFILGRGITYVPLAELENPFGIEIKFFSTTGEFVGMVGTTFDNANLIDTELSVQKIGGLKTFKFTITRDINIPFFNLMETRFFINGIHWYTGELQFIPGQDERDEEFEYTGKGYWDYLKKIKIEKLYINKTLEYMIKDIIENDISVKTPILYNPSLIIPNNITITKIEFKKKTAEKALKTLLEIANQNYTVEQYEMGVDLSKQFYFNIISNDLITGFFEGYQYQEPEVKFDLKNVVNQIDLYRAQENSQNVEFISQKINTTSQELYGVRNKDITFSDFIDQSDAEKIADKILSRNSNPFETVSINDLIISDNKFDIGFYSVNNKINEYTTTINEFNDISEWTKIASNTIITETSEKVLTGKKAFKFETQNGSSGEFIEYELDETIYFPEKISIWASQSKKGEAFSLLFFNEEGKSFDFIFDFIITEQEKLITDESGKLIITEISSQGIEINLVEDYDNLIFSIEGLDNIKKVRITINTNDNLTFFLDRLDIINTSYKQQKLISDSINYKQEKNTVIANCVFGERVENVIDNIKKLNEKTANTINIFQKS